MIAIIDYGMGNLGSIQNMLKRVGAKSFVTSKIEEIEQAKKIILPGVGAFDTAMISLQKAGLISILKTKALEEKVPLLGVCLGMQLLMTSSEEGAERGLNLIAGKACKFRPLEGLKVPHMGWNTIQVTKENALTAGLAEDSRFYFVHSYYVMAEERQNSLMQTKYGVTFDSAVANENIFGVQFHPEKSHRFGMKLLKNFAEIPC